MSESDQLRVALETITESLDGKVVTPAVEWYLRAIRTVCDLALAGPEGDQDGQS